MSVNHKVLVRVGGRDWPLSTHEHGATVLALRTALDATKAALAAGGLSSEEERAHCLRAASLRRVRQMLEGLDPQDPPGVAHFRRTVLEGIATKPPEQAARHDGDRRSPSRLADATNGPDADWRDFADEIARRRSAESTTTTSVKGDNNPASPDRSDA